MKELNLELECKEHDDFAEWRYGNLYVTGIMGICDNPLNEWPTLYGYSLDFGQVESCKDGDSLAAFSVSLPLRITIAQYYNNRGTLIVSYGLNEDKSRKVTDELVLKSGLVRAMPTTHFISSVTEQIRRASLNGYEKCEEIARERNMPLEKVFGRVYFVDFLQKYKGLPESQALHVANAAFK